MLIAYISIYNEYRYIQNILKIYHLNIESTKIISMTPNYFTNTFFVKLWKSDLILLYYCTKHCGKTLGTETMLIIS